jgi:nucleoside-diphosphate-sugar epimerase
MKYFITGATGFVGGHVARQLVRAGHKVIALVRTPSRASDLAALGIILYQGDITDKESMRLPMTGVDGVFHLAAWYKIGAKDHTMAEPINVAGTRNVLELMQELKIPKGVYTSTVGVFSDTKGRVVTESYSYHPQNGGWLNEYERTKWLAHYAVARPMIRAGLPLVIVQPGLVYGPGDPNLTGEAFRRYLQRQMPVGVKGTAYCWGYVEDTAQGHLLAMEKGRVGESYIIAGPVHTFLEALAFAEQITGIPGPRLRLSSRTLRAIATVMDLAGKIAPLPEAYTGETLRTSSLTYIASSEKAQRELGYAPRSLLEGLQETLPYEMKKLGIRLPLFLWRWGRG